jgi:hypothetical protein
MSMEGQSEYLSLVVGLIDSLSDYKQRHGGTLNQPRMKGSWYKTNARCISGGGMSGEMERWSTISQMHLLITPDPLQQFIARRVF